MKTRAPLLLLATLTSGPTFCQEFLPYNPFERPKNGPPLTNVFYKLKTHALWTQLKDPGYHASARMPDFHLTDDEALDVMAYLKRIAEAPRATLDRPPWAEKSLEEMEDDEFVATLELSERGQEVWSNARCTICHAVNGPGGEIIGGFVDLRVGGVDLQIAGNRLRRDWLYEWLRDPKRYFPDTLMPRFRLSEEEIGALVEYILRDDAFVPPEDAVSDSLDGSEMLDSPERASRGKKLIELGRCIVCHDVDGIPEILRLPEPQPTPAPGGFDFLAYDLRCLSCHAIEGRGGTYAPDLSGVGSRLQEPWVRNFVASPDMIRPLSQQMPKFNLTAEEARTIASYLSATRVAPAIPADIPGGQVTAEEIQRGRESFRGRACFACHNAGAGAGGVVGPDLAIAAERLKPGYIFFHLKDPHGVNPYTAEPDYGLSDEEARALAGFMRTRKK